jgi:hypothetical protein
MYGASFSKLIAPMDSPRLELSNGILFAKFRRRLSTFLFSGLILLENHVLQRRDGSSREGDGFCFGGVQRQ